MGLPYNVILGYPALAKFMAVTHHAYNIVKLSGCSGTITIRGDEKDTVRSIEHVYKAAAAAYPADEDLVEHVGGHEKKKQLVSQERAAAKKAAKDLPSHRRRKQRQKKLLLQRPSPSLSLAPRASSSSPRSARRQRGCRWMPVARGLPSPLAVD